MRISKRLDFDGYFTYYSARYSAATIALNRGADVNAVKELMDHAKLTTTNSYIGRAENSNVEMAMNMLRV